MWPFLPVEGVHSIPTKVRKQPLLRKAIPDLTPGAPARSVCLQTTSLMVAFLYMNTLHAMKLSP